jgi:nucleotide-binding universal stress UspA family protein
MSEDRQPDSARQPILLCYDGSPGSRRAVRAAGALFPGHASIVLHVYARVGLDRIRTTSVTAVRDELVEEVRVAARREATAVAQEGAVLGREAGLDARPLAVENEHDAAEAIVRVAIEQSAAAVVVGRPSRTRRALRPAAVSRAVLDQCPLPVVVA